MEQTYIPLYRKTLENDIFRFDPTAWRVFETLLLLANWKTGVWKGGRKQLAAHTNINDSTTYKAIKRLEKAGMVTLRANTNFTEYHICKWEKYQVQKSDGGNSRRSERGLSVVSPVTLSKNIINNNKEIYSVEIDEQVRKIYDHYIKAFNSNPNKYKLTSMRKTKIKSRLRDAGEEMLIQAIHNTASSNFHRGDNERSWQADLDWIVRSYEQVEKLAQRKSATVGSIKEVNINDGSWVAV